MLKFFRQYMNYILVVIVSVLMIAFLIQPTLSIFIPQPGDQVIGTIGGEELTVGEQNRAGSELDVLEQLARIVPITELRVGNPFDPPGIETPLQWVLVMREVESMGLSSSEYEVDELLQVFDLWLAEKTLEKGRAHQAIRDLAERYRVPVEVVREIIKKRMSYHRYLGLIQGQALQPFVEQIRHLRAADNLQQAGYSNGALFEILAAMGSPRVSEPVRQRFVLDQKSSVKIQFVPVDCDRYLHRVDEEPDDARLKQLFDENKALLPGEGKPYGLGYRLPDRVKLEYLQIPFDRVLATFPVDQIDEPDAIDYYDTHQDEFLIPAPPDSPESAASEGSGVRAYSEVRAGIKQRLASERARELSGRMIKEAQVMLQDQARDLTMAGGYRVIPDDWDPMMLREVAGRIKDRYKILPVVRRHEDRWLTIEDLVKLPGIVYSSVVVRREIPFIYYLMSVKELLDPEQNNPLATLRLQAKLSSAPLSTADGDRYLFRVIDAQRSHVPGSWEDVRDQLVRDARRLDAYELLKQDAEMWKERANQETLDGVAAAIETEKFLPLPFPRREYRRGREGFRIESPSIDGIGKSQPFIEAVFELADRVLQAGGVDKVAMSERVMVVPVDKTQKLALVRIDAISPLTKREYELEKSLVDPLIGQALQPVGIDPPVGIEALSERVGFKPDRDNREDPTGSDEDDTPDTPGTPDTPSPDEA